MQNGVNHAHSRNFLCRMDIHRNSSSIVFDHDTAISRQGNPQLRTVPCQMLINSIIQYFPYQMVQPPRSGTSNIHTRPLSDRFQSLQYDNLASIVLIHLLHPFLL